MYSNDGRSITLPYLVAGLLALMVYQSVELTWKVNLIRSLHRVEHPESIEYSASQSEPTLLVLTSHVQAMWGAIILPSCLCMYRKRP